MNLVVICQCAGPESSGSDVLTGSSQRPPHIHPRLQAAVLEDSDDKTRAIDSHFVRFLVLHVYKESRKHFCNVNMGKWEKFWVFIDVYAIIRTPMGSDLMLVSKSG